MPMPELRPATSEDAPACGKILQNWLDKTPWMPNLHSLKSTINFCRSSLIGEFKTTVAGDPVAGFISLEPDNSVAALYVAPTGQGTGRILLDHAKSGCDRLALWVFQANTHAIRFYERHGFKEVRRTDGANTAEKLPDIRMEWQS